MPRPIRIGLLLSAAVVAVYGQTAGFDFVNFDDDAPGGRRPRPGPLSTSRSRTPVNPMGRRTGTFRPTGMRNPTDGVSSDRRRPADQAEAMD